MLDFKKYLDSHTLRCLTLGKSGAEVYLLDDYKIAKFAEKSKLLEKENGLAVWESCLKEAKFYKEIMGAQHAFLPQIFHCEFDDEKVQIIMGEYKQVEKNNLSESDFEKLDPQLIAHLMGYNIMMWVSKVGILRPTIDIDFVL